MKKHVVVFSLCALLGCSNGEVSPNADSATEAPQVPVVEVEVPEPVPSKEEQLKHFVKIHLNDAREAMGYVKKSINEDSYAGVFIAPEAKVDVEYRGGDTARIRWETTVESVIGGQLISRP